MTAPRGFLAARAAAERETRVECLQPGDRFRWGRWFTVHRLRSTSLLPRPCVAVEVWAEGEADRAVLLFPVGHMVAAECER